MPHPKSTYSRGHNPASLANLHPWPKGQSANPEGRKPNAPLLTPALRKLATYTLDDLQRLSHDVAALGKLTAIEAIALQQIIAAMARDGDRARADLGDRLDGNTRPTDDGQADDDGFTVYLEQQRVIIETLRMVVKKKA